MTELGIYDWPLKTEVFIFWSTSSPSTPQYLLVSSHCSITHDIIYLYQKTRNSIYAPFYIPHTPTKCFGEHSSQEAGVPLERFRPPPPDLLFHISHHQSQSQDGDSTMRRSSTTTPAHAMLEACQRPIAMLEPALLEHQHAEMS